MATAWFCCGSSPNHPKSIVHFYHIHWKVQECKVSWARLSSWTQPCFHGWPSGQAGCQEKAAPGLLHCRRRLAVMRGERSSKAFQISSGCELLFRIGQVKPNTAKVNTHMGRGFDFDPSSGSSCIALPLTLFLWSRVEVSLASSFRHHHLQPTHQCMMQLLHCHYPRPTPSSSHKIRFLHVFASSFWAVHGYSQMSPAFLASNRKQNYKASPA